MQELSQAPVPPLESPHIHIPTFAHHRNKSLHKVAIEEPTNTYALLLPSAHLFAPAILQALYNFYSGYGDIRTWAPVRGLGRAIVVFEREEDGKRAGEEGGWFEVGGEQKSGNSAVASTSGSAEAQGDGKAIQDSVREQVAAGSGPSSPKERDYFKARKQTRKNRWVIDHSVRSIRTLHSDLDRANRNSILIRLLPLPPTPLYPPDKYLQPPPPPMTNTLISPPGSPPEGWEPIEEEGPNKETLAEDLAKALEEVRLNGKGYGRGGRRRGWGGEGDEGEGEDGDGIAGEDDRKEVILETDGGVTFTVEAPPEPAYGLDHSEASPSIQFDPTEEHHVYRNVPDEAYGGGESGWRTPGLGEATFSASGMSTPGGGRIGKIRTARPPLPSDQ